MSTLPHNKQTMSQSHILPDYKTIWSKAQATKQSVAALKRLFVSILRLVKIYLNNT